MVKKYEILEHLADLKIRAFGRTKEELFSNALFGMTESLNPNVKPDGKIIRQIKISSSDLSTLLVDFLSEVLYLIQVNKEAYFEINFNKFTETKIEGELIGQKTERCSEDIKAVTYHDLEIKKVDNHWEATVLFDI